MNIAARRCCEMWRRAAHCRAVAEAFRLHTRSLRGPLLYCHSVWGRSVHQSENMIRLLHERSAIRVCSRRYGDYPAHKVITLPNLSPTMETGSVLSWGRKEGESVMEGDLLAEIETDKATMSMDASDSGVLAKILVPAGTKDIPIGTPLCVIVENEADVAAFATFSVQSAGATAATASAEDSTAQQKQKTVSTVGETAPTKPTSSQPPLAAPVAAIPATLASQSQSGRIVASPYARTLASQRGLDLAPLAGYGSGPGGRIRAIDLDKALPQQPVTALGAGVSSGPVALSTDIELTTMRKVIAQRLTLSKRTVPHYSLTIDVPLDHVLEMRARINRKLSSRSNGATKPQKLSVNDFVIKAAAMACIKVPECNSSWHETFIRQYSEVDVSVAVATPKGLITPIVFGAHSKGLAQINTDVAILAAKAKENRLQPHEFQGGTFTVSNLGMFGVANFSAIINPPQSCILAVGGPQERLELVEDDNGEQEHGSSHRGTGNVRKATFMQVTLVCDHRVVDGAVGARWLREFKDNLEDPLSMLL